MNALIIKVLWRREKEMKKNKLYRIFCIVFAGILSVILLSGCQKEQKPIEVDDNYTLSSEEQTLPHHDKQYYLDLFDESKINERINFNNRFVIGGREFFIDATFYELNEKFKDITNKPEDILTSNQTRLFDNDDILKEPLHAIRFTNNTAENKKLGDLPIYSISYNFNLETDISTIFAQQIQLFNSEKDILDNMMDVFGMPNVIKDEDGKLVMQYIYSEMSMTITYDFENNTGEIIATNT